MNTEIEVKFVDINHDDIRNKLRKLGGVLEQPMRMMRRVTIDSSTMKPKNAFLRVRDEGYRTTLTYKEFTTLSVDGAKEIEIIVSDFQATVDLLAAAGLPYSSFQESKRETWKLGSTEIVLDMWPWLNPYIEIEGESEKLVREVAANLGLEWENAVFGDVMAAYRMQYPHIGESQTIGGIDKVRFDDPIPEFLQSK